MARVGGARPGRREDLLPPVVPSDSEAQVAGGWHPPCLSLSPSAVPAHFSSVLGAPAKR